MKRFLFAIALAGCAHTDVVRDRPGHVDVRTPPTIVAEDQIEPPDDPGETMLVLSPGVFGGGGVASGTDGAFTAGGEVSVHYGWSDHSHAEDDFFIYPPRAVGVNVGYNAFVESGGPRPGYVEVQYFDSLFGAAGGWAWDPSRRLSGPQVTAFWGPLYVRFMQLLSDRTELTVGVFFKLPYVWVWAR